ncbi:RagB/SusD family nutrient uptake outer membrane protein [Chitinophaga eiseniae]|uniref:RagB/SusD family nutrient uptake outer membrane protein n=1 Tax=Chitinophaga eiseniae TaxID=634771 RepID=A0A847STI2_9BACT|nr:RagB/SusD family nutrient uptake outer membrane protein [Chitinophaga eiseniae]NLR79682.1 RagB/SusD family nutrient uptake outer membrane protein [Chitinophaga eiseniae]
MKKIIAYITGTLILGSVACNKDALNKGPLNLYSDSNIWKDSALISRVVLESYDGIHSIYDDAGNWMPMDITDEGKSARSFLQSNLINTGQYSPSTGIYTDVWSNTYAMIRNCNNVLAHLPDMPLSEAGKQQIKGEMLFLRALHYMDLYSIFGRFPMVTKVLSLNDDLTAPRGTDDDCVKLMLDDLDQAAALLPAAYPKTAAGRATKYAALGMKCRLLLNRKDYQAAAAAAKEVIDKGGYTLFPDYEAMFYPENDDNQEVIFNKEFAGDLSGQVHALDLYDNSAFFTGFSSLVDCPTQNMVDQYLMKDGLPWNQSPKFDPAHPYANRDPRFHASIIYDGTDWINQTMDLKLGSKYNPSTYSTAITGYMLRKFLNPKYIFNGTNGNYQNCIMLRLGEIYLNYAECQLKLGNAEEARTYINLLRQRAGMPVVPAGQLNWDTYVRERTVELAFEGQRFNDIRRWGTGATMIGAAITAVQISETNGVRSYKTVPLEQRYWHDKMYYFPIPQAQLQKYPAGKVPEQNPGW